MPGTTPRQKRNRILALGGDAVELVIRGDTYDAAFALASADAAKLRHGSRSRLSIIRT